MKFNNIKFGTYQIKEYLCPDTLEGFQRAALEFFLFFCQFRNRRENAGDELETKHKNTKAMAYMSQEGYDKMVAKLRQMELVDRPAASATIAEARDKGDLSENSEYEAAKEAQAMLEMKISKLKAAIAEAKIIDASKIKSDTVQILSTVEIRNVSSGARMRYTIVSETEANLREGKISSQTPVAQGLLGHKAGDVVKIKIPQGTVEFEIMKITVG